MLFRSLLFAFFVILFSLSSSDPAGLVEGGGDEAGAVKQEEEIEEIEKQAQELKELKNAQNHLEIGEKLGLINVEKAAEVSGSRFSYIFGDLVKIEFNLVSYVIISFLIKAFFQQYLQF